MLRSDKELKYSRQALSPYSTKRSTTSFRGKRMLPIIYILWVGHISGQRAFIGSQRSPMVRQMTLTVDELSCNSCARVEICHSVLMRDIRFLRRGGLRPVRDTNGYQAVSAVIRDRCFPWDHVSIFSRAAFMAKRSDIASL